MGAGEMGHGVCGSPGSVFEKRKPQEHMLKIDAIEENISCLGKQKSSNQICLLFCCI